MKPPVYLEKGETLRHLGMDIELCDRGGRKWYKITQERDIQAYLDERGVSAGRKLKAPGGHKEAMMKESKELTEQRATQFRSDLGVLQFWATRTRWDIQQRVGGRFTSAVDLIKAKALSF